MSATRFSTTRFYARTLGRWSTRFGRCVAPHEGVELTCPSMSASRPRPGQGQA